MIYFKLGFRISKSKLVVLVENGGAKINVLGNEYPVYLSTLEKVLGAETVKRLADAAQ